MTLDPVTPKPSVHVRPATSHDIGFLTDVVIVATRAQNRVPDGFDEASWREEFARRTAEQVARPAPAGLEESATYVVEIEGERAGRMHVVRSPEAVELADIQLLPAHQGHGIGTHLIEQLVVEAHDSGRAARAVVDNDNPRARSLYERLGFVAVGGTEARTVLEAR